MNHKHLLGLLAGCASVAAMVPTAAHARTVLETLTYDDVILDTPATPDAPIVSPRGHPLTVRAEVNRTTGSFTVAPSGFSVPVYKLSAPLAGTIRISLKGPATGTLSFATGNLVLHADFLAKITLSGYGECTKNTGPVTLSTSAAAPFATHPFPHGATGPVTGDGAFGALWKSLAPGSGPACSVVDPVTAGSGGIWVSRGISPRG